MSQRVSTSKLARVVAVVPVYNNVELLRRSVASLLGQTLSEISVVVVSDASPENVWAGLEDISDPRLFRVELKVNRGMYFAIEAVRRAVRPEFLMIQDADDLSDPRRAEFLMSRITADDSAACLSAQYWHRLDGRAELLQTEHRLVDCGLDYFGWIGFHHGLFRNEALDYIGGYHGGQRIYYDIFVTCAIRMAGRVSYEPVPVYHRYETENSLTTSAATGHRSTMRMAVHEDLSATYDDCRRYWDAETGKRSFATIAAAKVSEDDRRSLDDLSKRLDDHFSSSTDPVFRE